MKVLFETRVLMHNHYTGVENYTNNIYNILSKKLQVISLRPKSSNKYLAHLWTQFILPLKNGDLLFSPANIAPIFLPKKKILVVTIHDISFLKFKRTFSILFKLYYQLMIPFVIKRANKIITISNYSKYEIEKYYPNAKNKIEVILLGVDKKYRIIDNIVKKQQILYVGSMNERKNILGVLQAFNKLENKKIKLVIVGNFLSNFNINEKIEKELTNAYLNSNIKFKNDVDNSELVKLYNESLLLLFPSFYEGFGLPVLEAMACGTPVVCSDSSSLPEVGGDAVVYCDAYDIDDIKDKIEMLLDDKDLQKKMIEKGLVQAKKFSWEKSANEHITLFKSLI